MPHPFEKDRFGGNGCRWCGLSESEGAHSGPGVQTVALPAAPVAAAPVPTDPATPPLAATARPSGRRFSVVPAEGSIDILEDPAGPHGSFTAAYARAKRIAGWPTAPQMLSQPHLRPATIPGELPRA